MKMPIVWHEQSLRNMRLSYEGNIRQLETLSRKLKREREEIIFYDRQIETAKAEGRDGFDVARYLKRKA